MQKQKLLFVGYGHMALAIIKGALNANLNQKYHFEITGRSPDRLKDFLKLHKLESYFTIISSECKLDITDKIVLLCIKPYGISSFNYIGKAYACLSVLAGTDIQTISRYIDSKGYVRIMPNTAASYQKSSSAVFCSGIQIELIEDIILSFGNCIEVNNENLIDASIATSGSAPAFIALIAQALIDSGVREGLTRSQSKALVRGMFDGFAKLLNNQEPQEIIDAITSPGGTTIEGLSILEKHGIRGAIIEAGHQAVLKAKK